MSLSNRCSTLQHEAVKELTKALKQPVFTAEDQEQWRCIWAPAFALDHPQAREQDHIVGLRELAKENIWGVDSRWNLLPCSHKENVAWKKKLFPRIAECILRNSWEFDGAEDYDDIENVRFAALCKWVSYCQARGAQLWVCHDGLDEVIKLAGQAALKEMRSVVWAAWSSHTGGRED